MLKHIDLGYMYMILFETEPINLVAPISLFRLQELSSSKKFCYSFQRQWQRHRQEKQREKYIKRVRDWDAK